MYGIVSITDFRLQQLMRKLTHQLQENALDDPKIRKNLRLRISNEYGYEEDLVIIDELGVFQGEFRVDVAAVNGCLHGYEIKSDVDSLARLSKQLTAYSRIFEYLTLVVGQRHLKEARKIIPSFCGLLLAQSNGEQVILKQIRAAKKNRFTDPNALVQLLWKDEALRALESLGIEKGFKSKPRKIIWNKLVEKLPNEKLQQLIISTLKTRPSWRADSRHA